MSAFPSEFAALAHLLPEARVGNVSSIEPISLGLSGAGVYAVSSDRGEAILRINAATADASRWSQQLRLVRSAAELGVAPALLHVDEDARAIVSVRVRGVPLGAALSEPATRQAALTSIVTQLRALHALDATGIDRIDPLAHARAHHVSQRTRAGFPAWADGLEPIFDQIAAMLASDPRRVVSHNDLNPGNLLWDGTRAWLVDWEVAGLAHPFYDLAALAMFLRLPDEVAHGLLAYQEQRALGDADRAIFAALRQLVALLCGLTMLSLVPDLGVLPETAPSLAQFYQQLRAGALALQDPRGRAYFALALLRTGVEARTQPSDT